MSSLYKRATISQQRVLKIVEGAVKNAAHAHPEGTKNKAFARSVAKRAVGTLTAQWPDVLALRDIAASERASEQVLIAGASSDGRLPSRRAEYLYDRRRRRLEARKVAPLAILHELHRDLGILAMVSKWGELDERTEALQDALKLVAHYITQTRKAQSPT